MSQASNISARAYASLRCMSFASGVLPGYCAHAGGALFQAFLETFNLLSLLNKAHADLIDAHIKPETSHTLRLAANSLEAMLKDLEAAALFRRLYIEEGVVEKFETPTIVCLGSFLAHATAARKQLEINHGAKELKDASSRAFLNLQQLIGTIYGEEME